MLIRVALDLKASREAPKWPTTRAIEVLATETASRVTKNMSSAISLTSSASQYRRSASFLANTVMIAKPCIGRLGSSERRDRQKNGSRTMIKLSHQEPITGKRHNEEVEHESDHFYLGSTGGKVVDARDLRQVIWHD
jgi:hypothetical protein